MTDTSWKREERQIAHALGVERNPNIGRSHPDVESGPWVIEVKKRRRLPQWIKDAMTQAVRNTRPGRIPLVVISEVRQGVKPERLVVIRFDDFREWYGGVGR